MTPAAGAPGSFSFSLEPMDFREIEASDNLLQSGFWGAFKAAAGWTPRGFKWGFTPTAAETLAAPAATATPAGGSYQGRFLLLERRFPGGLKMAYIPYGPELPEELDADSAGVSTVLESMASELKKHLPKCCFVIRFDLTGGSRGRVGRAESAIHPEPLSPPLLQAPYRVQPPDTVILSLIAEEKDLLSRMHKKTRYNIRLSERKGVTVHRYRDADALEILPLWYRLYEETGRRDGISLHPESYYRRLFEKALAEGAGAEAVSPRLSLYTAEHEKDILAGIIVSRSGRRATYMYGASGALKRELMPNHLLQWTAITDARNEGAEEYDFFGIPPADNPSHPMHGLWRFKTGFGGDILHYRGAWDYPLKPAIYSLYRWAEKLRAWQVKVRKSVKR